MTRLQQDAARMLEHAEAEWLRAYYWREKHGGWTHPQAPKFREVFSQRDALAMTRAEPLRFGSRPL